MIPFFIRWAATLTLLTAIYRGSRVALVIVLALQAAANEMTVWLIRRKADR